MKFTTINSFKQYLIREGLLQEAGHMSFDGGNTATVSATPISDNDPGFTITGENEGEPQEFSGEMLADILATNFKIAKNAEDFVNKITYHITDETAELSDEDELKLTTWYMEQNGEDTEDNSKNSLYDLMEKINELDIYIHEHTSDGTEVKKFNQVIDKFIGEYNPEKQDGVPLRDTIAEAGLSATELKSIIAELTEIKNSMQPENNENPLLKYGTFEELKNIKFDVKVWLAPDGDDNENFEPCEGTTPGQEGWYWALNMNYEKNEDGVYFFGDHVNHTEYIVEVDAADLATDVRESNVQKSHSEKQIVPYSEVQVGDAAFENPDAGGQWNNQIGTIVWKGTKETIPNQYKDLLNDWEEADVDDYDLVIVKTDQGPVLFNYNNDPSGCVVFK